MSAWRALRARWRMPAAVVALELLLAWLVAARVASLAAAPLRAHPEGAAALFAPGGARLAMDLVFSRERELRAGLMVAGLTVTAYATLSLWLALALARALGAPGPEGTLRSAAHAARKLPGAVALGLLALGGYAACAACAYLTGGAAADAVRDLADPRARDLSPVLAGAPFAALGAAVLAWHDHARAHLVLAAEGPLAAARAALARILAAPRDALLPLPLYLLAGLACVLAGGALDAALAARFAPVPLAAAAQLVPLLVRATARAHWLARVTESYRGSAA